MISKQLPTALAIAVCSMIFGTLGTPEAAAQRGGFSARAGTSSISLLDDSKVAEELELDDEQVEALAELKNAMKNVYRETFGGMRDRFRGPDVDREAIMQEIGEQIKTKMKTVDAQLSEVLLPHQMSRLSELNYQMQAKRGGTEGLLDNSKIKEELGITDDQLEEVSKKSDEVKKKLEEKIIQLRKDAQDEILSVLTKEQQTKIKSMLGESFSFDKNPEWEGGRGGRGGREGRGGRGGRGGRDGGDREGGRRGRRGGDDGDK